MVRSGDEGLAVEGPLPSDEPWVSDSRGVVLVNLTTVEREAVAGGGAMVVTTPTPVPLLRCDLPAVLLRLRVSIRSMTISDSARALFSDAMYSEVEFRISGPLTTQHLQGLATGDGEINTSSGPRLARMVCTEYDGDRELVILLSETSSSDDIELNLLLI